MKPGPGWHGRARQGLLASNGMLAGRIPAVVSGSVHDDFTLSGTSQATAVVAAWSHFMLQVEPAIEPR